MNKRFVYYLLLLALLLGLAIAYLQKEMMILFAIFVTLPMISLVSLPFLWWGVQRSIELVLPETTAVNKTVECRLRIYNRSYLPVPLTVCPVVVEYPNQGTHQRLKTAASLAPRRETVISFQLELGCCGPVRISVKKMQIFDLFSIFCMRKKINLSREIMVLPKVSFFSVKNREANMGDISNSDRFHATKSGEDPSEIMGVREYRAGDKLQKIHWKLTAKTDSLMVREYGSPLGCHIVLYVDPVSASMEEYHAKMTAVMSVAMSMLEAECVFMLLWPNETEGLCRSIIFELEDLYEAFSNLLRSTTPKAKTDLYDALEELRNPERFRQVIYVTGDLSWEQGQEIFSHKNSFTNEMYVLSIQNDPKDWNRTKKQWDVPEKEKDSIPVAITEPAQMMLWLFGDKLEEQLERMELVVM